MKTQSEMREDAQRLRESYFFLDEYAARAQDGLHNDTTIKRPIVIPEGTLVMVCNRSKKLTPHTLKKAHMFMSYLVGCEPAIEFHTATGRVSPAMTNPAELLKVSYYTFETLNPDWPYMVVAGDRLTTEEKK